MDHRATHGRHAPQQRTRTDDITLPHENADARGRHAHSIDSGDILNEDDIKTELDSQRDEEFDVALGVRPKSEVTTDKDNLGM
jgi:hypothetical protein